MNTPIINDFKSYETKIFSVSEINKLVKDMLQHNFPIILVKGEISNFIEATSGHWYFSLKDSNAQVRCTMFKGKNSRIKWKPKNGESIEAECKVGLYEARGEYQLNVESLQKSGLGDLFEEFNRLKEKLIAEGLFDEVNKKPIPSFVKRVGVVTSPDGAVVRDIISTLKRRNEFLKIVIYPTPVQGNGSVEGIVNALNTANQRDEVDVVILARGGGSIEDLWSFNDENVARCISQSILPTISAIGHETDVTISDFIADLRAPTPTAAAEIVSINLSDIFEKLEYFNLKLLTIIQSKIDYLYQKIDYLEKRLMSPSEKIIAQNVLIKNYLDRITISMKSSLNNLSWSKIDKTKIEDRWAQIYSNNKKNKFYKTIEKYLEVIPKSKLVLEYGCSIGIISEQLSNSSEMVFGVDKSFNAIQIAKKNKKSNADYFVSDFTATPFTNKKFDLIIALNVLELMEPNILLKQISKQISSGNIVISDPYDYERGINSVKDPINEYILRKNLKKLKFKISTKTKESSFIPWNLKLHDRASLNYKVDIVIAKK